MTNSTYLPGKIENQLDLPISADEIEVEASILLAKLLGYNKFNEITNHSPTDLASVYNQLIPFFDRPDESLDPSPEINNALTQLVSLLQGEGMSKKSVKNSFPDIAKFACSIIDSSKQLSSRAFQIRGVASRAESRLEFYYVEKLISSPLVCINYIRSLSYPERIAYASRQFPYIGNYVTMVEQESRILSSIRNPSHIVFCGSGPLPLTGLLLAAHTKVKVTLVDNDFEAVEASRKLIKRWESSEVIPTELVSVIHADGASLTIAPRTESDENAINSFNSAEKSNKLNNISCDILFIAALIPNDVKETLIKTSAKMRKKAPLVVLRTAHGLTARLAYQPSIRTILQKHLNLIATVVPEVHKISVETPPGVDSDDIVPIDWFPSEILNSLDIYSWSS